MRLLSWIVIFSFSIARVVLSLDQSTNGACTLYSRQDCNGNDLSHQGTSSPQSCCDLCSQTSGCGAFTFMGSVCYMKTSCPSKQDKSDCTSGIVNTSPTPPPTPPTPRSPTPVPIFNLNGVESTQDLSHLLTNMSGLPGFVTGAPPSNTPTVTIDRSETYQTILGFGGAFTEAAAINFYTLSASDQKKVIQLYFAPPEEGGHGYTIGRVPINSCDFSPASYSFDDVAGDTSLAHFDRNVSHDLKAMIPFIHNSIKAAKDGLKIFASPWSPPAWMKTNGKMTGSGHPGLKSEDQAAWALYFSKFFTAYKNKGIDLWGLTVQNEPEYAAGWEACCYTAEEERDFLKNHLGPVMRRDHPNVKIMVFDHNKDDVVNWAKTIFGDAEARKYADGIAVHWYTPGHFDALETTHAFAPDKFILPTEACNCNGVHLKNWNRGADLSADMLGDLNAWAVGWTDWNLILNPQGGPNHLGNLCDANIIADPNNKLNTGSSIIKQVSYYQMGHFSRYLRPGAVRVKSSQQHTSSTLGITSFYDPVKKTTSVVLMNRNNNPVKFALYDMEKDATAFGLTIPGHSMQTLVY